VCYFLHMWDSRYLSFPSQASLDTSLRLVYPLLLHIAPLRWNCSAALR